jgi:hypothetical protein
MPGLACVLGGALCWWAQPEPPAVVPDDYLNALARFSMTSPSSDHLWFGCIASTLPLGALVGAACYLVLARSAVPWRGRWVIATAIGTTLVCGSAIYSLLSLPQAVWLNVFSTLVWVGALGAIPGLFQWNALKKAVRAPWPIFAGALVYDGLGVALGTLPYLPLWARPIMIAIAATGASLGLAAMLTHLARHRDRIAELAGIFE